MLFLILKLFVLDIVRVNSSDMLDTFSPGTSLLLLKSTNNFERNDVISFRFPVLDGTKGEDCIQRVIALPGDSIEIKDKVVFVNGEELKTTASLRFNYFVRFIKNPDSVYLQKMHLTEGGAVSDNHDFSFTLNKVEADSLRRDSLVKTVEMKLEKAQVFNESVFPYSSYFAWNPDNFGKLYIPARGDTLLLDSLSAELYENIITVFEKNKLYRHHDSIYINDVYRRSYVVKQNYYFVMGDNRDNAVDSRYFGFVPAGFIRGKIIATLKRTSR